MIEISFVIISYNHFDLLQRTLQSIVSFTQNVEYEIIIIDNNSSEGDISELIKAEQSLQIYKNEKNIGWPSAVNQGISYSKGKFICIVDNDVIFIENLVEHLLDVSNQYNDKAVIAPRLLFENRSRQPSLQDFPTIINQIGLAFGLNVLFPSSGYLNPNHKNHKTSVAPFQIDMAMGACLFFPKTIAMEINYFDKDYFFYSSDTDFCYRHKKNNGIVIYCPSASVIHLGSISSSKLNFTGYRYLSRDNIVFYRKHFKRWKRYIFYHLLIISAINRSILWFILGCVTFKKMYIVKSFNLFMKALFTIQEIIRPSCKTL